MMERMPIECFPVGDFILEELEARGWSKWDLAVKMGGDPGINYLAMEFMYHLPDEKNLYMGKDLAEQLGKAFDVDPQWFLNLEASYRQWKGLPVKPEQKLEHVDCTKSREGSHGN